MRISNLIDKIRGIATEQNDDNNCETVIMVKNEDGTYMEVISDEDH